ncbi:glycosyltransferase family 2 protein [Microbacterium profundi]|uniref:glycosyltransferase family 2 protein n=1 Tax=Microbacterium profundi TaxID=450380 RepID=UPI001F397FEE|nr:glycosyltransferase family A protein [Microbacterium profundi]MCE7482861.1 glycosyltransferase family 2 protein [Microbacterium profundi]
MPMPKVDVIIPVHTPTRPIRRAVRSVLANSVTVRVTVVAHNTDAVEIADNLADLVDHPDVRIISLHDGIPSPAGPMNHGIDAAEAPYFAVLGSDDELEPGAIDSWHAVAVSTGATTVIPRVHVEERGEPTPPTRRGRTRDLDPVKDRLSYRCMPLGLIDRSRFTHLRFTPGLASGEDLEFTAELWFTGSRIAYDREGPAYFGHNDATDRVTGTIRPLAEDFAFLEIIAVRPWYAAASVSLRRAFGVKNLRVHLLDAVATRLNAPGGIGAYSQEILAVAARIEQMSPGATALLARADRKVLGELGRTHPSAERIRQHLAARWGGGLDGRLTANPLLSFHRQAPYRTLRDMVP